MMREESLLLASRCIDGAPARVFFVNAHCVNIAQNNAEYRAAVDAAEFVFNDGVGIEVLCAALGVEVSQNLNGTDWIPALFRSLRKREAPCTLYFLGGVPKLVEIKCQVISRRWPHIRVVGGKDGFLPSDAEVLEDIRRCSPDIVLLGMGVPRQELFLHRNWQDLCEAGVKLGIAGGAVADFLIGAVPRAPKWMRRRRLEWAYRLWQEPGRMFSRYVLRSFQFLAVMIREWWGRRVTGKIT